MSEVNNSGWYALVKYKSANITEVLPVHKIKVKIGKSQRVAFNPKSLTDFDKTKFYTVNTTHGSEDGKEHKWYALIGLLAESREALEHTMIVKRISWPTMLHDESEPNTTDNDVLEQASPSNITIINNRDSNRKKKKAKKDATDAVHAKLLASKSFNPSSTYNVLMSETNNEDVVTRLLRENEELKSALQAEKERNNPPGEVTDYINTFKDCMKKIEDKFEIIQDNFQKNLDSATKENLQKFIDLQEQMTNVENSIKVRPLSSASSATSSSSILSDVEEKIPLGDGIFCSKAAFHTLTNIEASHADWAYALLKGVFGEKAHLMRVRITKKHTKNERFPPNFLLVAKSLHRDWLLQQKIQDENGQLYPKYSITEVEKYVNALPAYLADRCYDMRGPRGVNTREKDRDISAPKRRQDESMKPKRKYMRRGQPLHEIQQPQQLIHQLPHQELPPQEQLSQPSLPLHSVDFVAPSTSGAVAVTSENPETFAATYTTL